MSHTQESRQTTYMATIGFKCDCCGKEVLSNENMYNVPDGWHQFTTLHNDWGNDSYEDSEDCHACSAKCFIEVMKKQLQRLSSHHTTAELGYMNYSFAEDLVKLLNP